MRIPTRIAAASLLLLASPCKAEDVERRPTFIEPPPPAALPAAPEPEMPADGPRYPFDLPGPKRIYLGPLGDFVAPEAPAPETEHERVSRRLDHFFGEAAARRRVELGDVDEAWHKLAQRVEHYWRPDFTHVREARISELSGDWFRDTLWQWLGGWYAEVQHSRQDPFLRPERVPGDERYAAWASLLDLQRDCLGDGYGNRVVALVEIRFDADGRSRSSMLSSSGHPLYDQAVMQGVAQALAHSWSDAPPEGPARAVYAMTSNYTILPPIPVVGFTFDIMLGQFDLFYPFKKMVSGKAVLVAVYGPR
ncbi:MAG: TonB C-terminal domain-containing protein [Deltaproteobacteria bacterium]|nr:TonB C-terminal domain-containing protein [Deltaproteobacteria bacterium]